LNKEYKPKKSIIVSNEKEPRVVNGITVMPWKDFLCVAAG
jgi:hypothetical protein